MSASLEGHGEIESQGLADLQGKAGAYNLGESSLCGGDLVTTRLQKRRRVDAHFVGRQRQFRPSVHVFDHHGGARDNGAIGIGERPRNQPRSGDLTECHAARVQKKNRNCEADSGPSEVPTIVMAHTSLLDLRTLITPLRWQQTPKE
jgi:hypothetical protein